MMSLQQLKMHQKPIDIRKTACEGLLTAKQVTEIAPKSKIAEINRDQHY